MDQMNTQLVNVRENQHEKIILYFFSTLAFEFQRTHANKHFDCGSSRFRTHMFHVFVLFSLHAT